MGPRGEVLWSIAMKPPWSRSHYDSNCYTNKYGGDERYLWTQAERFAGAGTAPVHVLVRWNPQILHRFALAYLVLDSTPALPPTKIVPAAL